MTNIRNNNGIAMAITLMFMVILVGTSGIFVLRSAQENKEARAERDMAEASLAAQGGNQKALQQLDVLINDYLRNTIASANPSGVINFASNKVSSGDGIGWLLNTVRHNNNPVLSQNGEQAEYSANGSMGQGNYQYMIIMTEKTDPVAAGSDAWDFPYSYRVQTTGTSGGAANSIMLSGDFTVRVQKDNFAKFALFTNTQSTPTGSEVWFTNKTNFAGPVHTNDRFNFALNPSGTFEDIASQNEQKARFYNMGSPVLLNADSNGSYDVPAFHNGFNRNAGTISLNLSTQQQDVVDQALGGQTFSTDGIYVPNDGTNLSGGIYVKGNASSVLLSVSGNNQVYTLTQGSTTIRVTTDAANNQTTVEDVGAGTSQTYTGLPDGLDDSGTIIHVDGNITSLSGTVESNSTVTLSGKNDIKITDNLVYSDYTPAVGNPGDAGYIPPSAAGTNNLLGLVTWEGDIRIGTAAPDNIQIHGTVLAQNGIFQVDSYDDSGVGPRGTATLLGGVVTDNYGAFGLFNGSTGQQISGYGRNFIYDQRMLVGTAPPYFPTLNTFIAFTNDITDRMVWQEGE